VHVRPLFPPPSPRYLERRNNSNNTAIAPARPVDDYPRRTHRHPILLVIILGVILMLPWLCRYSGGD
jgi:hypothetical protein